ncbi:lytic transglycosylase domain-containing protein [Aminipila butyrica]|uniref:Lytic transglycosylase domain-containing protein n=1 Tax=Aminipila butyrica TaxID=433296 RepID=A0A858BUL7_9FIRM|nr:lytic transglycosylase domain-containing protein [Aminipila butyrica]QIB69633.1 lytic transglycosylase domain-containing protein [Aminipila butyrica]
MSIDRVNLNSQYGKGSGLSLTTGALLKENEPDFQQTLNKILPENQRQQWLSSTSGDVSARRNTDSGSLEDIFNKAADTYDVPVELLKAMAKAESGFNANAVSKCGAMGIMQLMPATAKALGVVDAYDPEQNIMGGANYISQKLKAYDGDITLALAAYNAGSGNVAKYGGVPPFKETQNYIKKIYGYMGEDLQLPNQPLQSAKSSASGVDKLLGNQDFSEMSTEQAYLAARLQMLRHQWDMQEIFASAKEEDQEQSDDLQLNLLLNSLKNL